MLTDLIYLLSAILAYHVVLGQQITLPLTGGSNTDPAMVANPRVNLSLFSSQSALVKAMADIHDRFATYLFDRAAKLGCEAASLAAIIYVESGGKGFSGSRMIIRFENHVFRPRLNNDVLFYNHFTYNTDQAWTGHTWRASTSDTFQTFHGNQDKEWTVLQFAQGLNDLAALESASYGAPQIMGFNAQSIGYANARAMFLAFSNSLEKQMDGMIEFIKGRANCLAGLRNNDFVQFAGCYNGAGQAQTYGANILGARNAYLTVLSVLNIVQPTTCQYSGLYGVCGAASSCQGEAYSGVAACGSEQCCISRISCKPSGQPEGSCMDQSRCLPPGQLFSGLCPGGSTIKCCAGGPTPPPTTRSPTVAVTSAPTPPVSCSFEGLSGQCLTTCSGSNVRGYADSECTGGKQCCVPAQACTPASGLSGTCVDSSVCSGTTFSGFCPGSSAIRCCVPTSAPTIATPAPSTVTKTPTAVTNSPTIATKSPTKTSSPTQQPTTRSPTFVECTIDDGLNTGECKDVSLCNGAFSPFPGFCPGPTNIQCCVSVPVKTRAPTFALTSSPTTSCTYEGLTGYCSSTSSCAASLQAYSIAPSGSCSFCCTPSPTCSQSGRCIDTAICPSGSTILSGLCPGSTKIKCCKPSSLLSDAQDDSSEEVSSSTTVAVGVSVPLVLVGALAMTVLVVLRRRKQHAGAVDNARWSVVAHPKAERNGPRQHGQLFGNAPSTMEGDNPLFSGHHANTSMPPRNINV